MSQQEEGEKYFEDWARQHDVQIKRIREAKGQRPDYWIRGSGGACVAEIKDLDQSKDELAYSQTLAAKGRAIHSSVPGERLERRLRKAAAKYQPWKRRRIPCVTVAFNNSPIFSSTSPIHVFAAMFGSLGVSVSVGPDAVDPDIAGTIVKRGPVQPGQNTSTSAVAVLEWSHGSGWTLLLYHNPYAINPLLPEVVAHMPGIQQFRVRGYDDSDGDFWVEIDAA